MNGTIGNRLVWTMNKPTVPGWYWSRLESGHVEVCTVLQSDIDNNTVGPGVNWAGPLEMPEELGSYG
jgi:hypothetical protein